MQRPTPPPVVAPVTFFRGCVGVGHVSFPLGAAPVRSAAELLDLIRADERLGKYSITPLVSDGSELTDLTVEAGRMACVRLGLRDDFGERQRVAARNSAAVDAATQAVAQRPAVRTLANRLAVREGDVVTLVRAAADDADWLECECEGRTGRLPRTALLDVYEVAFEAEWHEAPVAQWELGWRHLEGWSGLRRDEQRGALWIQWGASLDHTLPLFALAALHSLGRGVPQDEAQSRYLVEKCAARGHSFAQERLADIKADEGKPEEAYALYLAAAEQGILSAMVQAAYSLAHGVGVKRDLDAAVHWLSLASAADDATAMRRLGQVYGLELSDTRAAIEWISKAIDAGELGAMPELAHFLLYEDPAYADVARGEALLHASAARGDPMGTGMLAERYDRAGNVEEAIWWYEASGCEFRPTWRHDLRRCYHVLCPELPHSPQKLA